MKIPRRYYKPQQLADYWQMPLDDVMQLGLTEYLQFMIQADFEFPELKEVKRGEHTKIDYLELANIYHANEPVIFEGICTSGENAGFKCLITFPHGIDRLIIQASEVQRFESEQQNTPLIESNAPSKIEKLFNQNKMLKLIETMAIDAYGYNPNERNTATGGNSQSISEKMAKHGLKIHPDTIRDYLKAAKNLP